MKCYVVVVWTLSAAFGPYLPIVYIVFSLACLPLPIMGRILPICGQALLAQHVGETFAQSVFINVRDQAETAVIRKYNIKALPQLTDEPSHCVQ